MDGFFMKFTRTHTVRWQVVPAGPSHSHGVAQGVAGHSPRAATATRVAAEQVKARRCLSLLRSTQSFHQPFLTWD